MASNGTKSGDTPMAGVGETHQRETVPITGVSGTPQQTAGVQGIDQKDTKNNEFSKEAEERAPSSTSSNKNDANINNNGYAAGKREPAMTRAVWLACIGLGLAYTTAFQQNACTSAIVKHIDDELGPTDYYNWIISAYTIAVAVTLPLSGGLSDIFGRKGFFIVGCLISLTGTVVALAAQNIPMIIAGMILKGVGSGCQQLALAAIAEIVPNKHRGNAQAVLDLVTLPWAIFGPLIGNAMVKFQALSFRINFIIGVILNILTIIAIFIWYHPPAGRILPGETRRGRLRELDWFGLILMAVGIVLTLMGLSFGGKQFEWGEAGVIAPLVIGLASLAGLGFWEARVAKNPFFAHELFRGKARTFTIQLFLTFVGGMSLYTAAAFWTQQCQSMFKKGPIEIGISAIPGGVGGATGGFLGGISIGKGKLFGSNRILFYGSLLKMISDAVMTTLTPNTFPLALGMGFLAMFGMGLSLVALIVCVQLASEDKHIGLATLVLGSVRAIGGSVAVTIYTSIMTNTVKKEYPPRAARAAVALGVKPENVKALLGLLQANPKHPEKALAVPGATVAVLKAVDNASAWSYSLAFRNIYYAAVAFSVLAVVASLFVKDITRTTMTNSVAVTLTNDKDKRQPEKRREAV